MPSFTQLKSALLAALLVLVPCTAMATDIIAEVNTGFSAADVAARYSITIQDQAPGSNFYLFSTPLQDPDTLEVTMRLDPAIKWVEIDENLGLNGTDTTSRGGTLPVIGSRSTFASQNKDLLTQINWQAADVTGLASVRVAVIDTGFSPLSAALAGKVVYTKDEIKRSGSGLDFPVGPDPVGKGANKSVGHGTMVSSIIASLVPSAKLLEIKVAGSDGHATAWSVIRGIADAVRMNAQVCNVSLGSPNRVLALEQVMDWATTNGLLVVAPIGNEGLNQSDFPAALDGVICVAGIDSGNRKAPMSNFDRKAIVAAPSEGVTSYDWDGHLAVWSGTSFAAPQVTAALAAALASTPGLSRSSAVRALDLSGFNIDPLNPLYSRNLGLRLDFHNFLRIVASGRIRP